MLTVRHAADRGRSDLGWLDSRHTFSFSDYFDPDQVGFRALRVINDDRVHAGRGFGPHPHRDMEILSFVLDGALGHRDSTGSSGVIRAGDVQRMSAGTGVTHAEMNASQTEAVRFLQIWIVPDARGGQPGYEQKTFADADKRGKLRLVASPDGRDGSVTVRADACVYTGILAAGERAELAPAAGRGVWVQVARGRVRVNGQDLAEGDGAKLESERQVTVEGGDGGGEVLVFDLK
jgi:redox-sensitive bicupin YhaK (pirin superfamily)